MASVFLTVRLPSPEMRDLVKRTAARRGLTTSDLVRNAVYEAVAIGEANVVGATPRSADSESHQHFADSDPVIRVAI